MSAHRQRNKSGPSVTKYCWQWRSRVYSSAKLYCTFHVFKENSPVALPSHSQLGRPGTICHRASAPSPRSLVWCLSGRCCDCGNCAHSCLDNKARGRENVIQFSISPLDGRVRSCSLSTSLYISHLCTWKLPKKIYLTWNRGIECETWQKIQSVTHWWQQHVGWPSLHRSHPSLPRDSWRSALCSP